MHIIIFNFTEYLLSELMAVRMLKYTESHPEETNGKEHRETNGKEQRKQESLTMGNEDEHQKTSQEDKTNWKEVNKGLAELFQTLGLETSSQMSDACAEVGN